MSAQPAPIKKQVKQYAKNLKKNVEVGASLEALLKLDASLDLYEKYDVRYLAKQYVADPIFSDKAAKLRTFLKDMRKQRKQEETKCDAENRVKENRKRHSDLAMGYAAKKVCAPLPEPKQFGMKKSKILMEKNGKTTSNIIESEAMFLKRKDEKRIYSGRKKITIENGHFTKSSQILRKCDGISFDEIRPAFEQCTSSEKLKFIKMNLGFVKESDDSFKKLTINEFEGITKLPNRYEFWYQYYHILVTVYRKNEEVSKLEELTARIAENRRKTEDVRKTKVIDTVHAGTSRRPTLVAQRPSNFSRRQ